MLTSQVFFTLKKLKKKKKVRWQIGMLPKQPSRLFSRQRKSCCSPAHTLLASASPGAILRLSVSRVHLLGGGRRGLRSPAPHASLHVRGYCGARRAPGAARGDTKSPPQQCHPEHRDSRGEGASEAENLKKSFFLFVCFFPPAEKISAFPRWEK